MATPLRVLLLEDNPDDAELVLHQLRQDGFAPLWQRVETEADYLAHLDENLDIILADYSLPQFDAPHALELRQQRDLDVPFIVVTGAVGDEQAVLCMKQGATDFVLKDRLGRLGQAVQQAMEQYHLRAEMRRSAAQLRKLSRAVEQSPVSIVITDAAGNTEYVNPKFTQTTGYALEEVQGQNLRVLNSNETPPETYRELWETITAGREWQGVFHNRKKNGELFWETASISPIFDEAGGITHFVAVKEDITARRQAAESLQKANDELEIRVAERTAALAATNEVLSNTLVERERIEGALRENHDLLRAVTESTTDCIFVKDLQGRYLMINSSGARYRGMTPEEVLGKLDTDLFSPETAHVIMEADRRILAAGNTQTYEETTVEDGVTRTHLVTKGVLRAAQEDGVTHTFLVTKGVLRDMQGEISGIVGMARDISERKRAEIALQEAKEEAERANRAKSEFLSRMSHELRTPLNAILGFGQILERRDLGDLENESVGHILKGGRHLLELINEILDIARIEAGRISLSIEPIAVDDVLAESLDLVWPLAPKYDVHITDFAGIKGRIHVLADRQRLKQVLINLLTNAVKYNRQGGSVTVACREVAADRVRIEVSDTGYGLTADEVKLLFVPFERLSADKTGVEGTGLGLTLSHRLIEAMGGTIGVESVPGEGSTFFIELPLAESPLQTNGLPENSLEPDGEVHPELACTVLSIEDNLSNYRLIEAILAERPGVKLIGAMQGSIGLEMAQLHRPDLILLDVHLPDIDGDEVLRRLRAFPETAEIPVVIVSADATETQIERLMAVGANAYLTKPLNVKEMLRVLDEFLQKGH